MEVELNHIAEYLKGLSFGKTFRGAREDQVYSAMRTLNEMYAEEYRRLQALCDAETAKAEEDSRQFSRMLLTFQGWKEQESERIRAQSEETLTQASAQADELVEAARRKADELLAARQGEIREAEATRDALVSRLSALGEGLREMERDAASLCERLAPQSRKVISMPTAVNPAELLANDREI